MSHIRFNHVFLMLLVTSGATAFFVPMEYSGRLRGHIDGLFAPVAYPIRQFAYKVTGTLSSETAAAEVGNLPANAAMEIQRLKTTIASLNAQLELLALQQKMRERVGPVEKYSLPFKVIGGGDGFRDSLSISGSSGDGLEQNMAVVCPWGLVGRVASAGQGGARIQLITDGGFKVQGSFRRNTANGSVRLVTKPPLVIGRRDGIMSIANLSLEQIKDVREGDDVVLDDDSWPILVRGLTLGTVHSKRPQPDSPLWAEIIVSPRVDLRQLREVLVVTEPTGPAPVAAGPGIKAPAPAQQAQQGARRPPARGRN